MLSTRPRDLALDLRAIPTLRAGIAIATAPRRKASLLPAKSGIDPTPCRRSGGAVRTRVITALATLGFAAATVSAQPTSDFAREQRWAAQIVPSLVVGEAVTLTTEAGVSFLALHTSVANAKRAVLLTHGPGLHPDHGIVGELRAHLADRGYTTLSLQMPVLAADVESGEAYRALFPDAVQRIASGIEFLRRRDSRPVAIVSHAMGSAMAYEYLRLRAGAPVAAWVAMSYYGDFGDLPAFRFPIFDVYGSSDYWGIRGPAFVRAWKLRSVPGSQQRAISDGGRFLAGGDKEVMREVAAFLDALPK